MERFTATLKRKVGPFTVGIWLIIVVVGVALGLALRKRLGASSEDSSGSVEGMVAGGPTGVGLGPNTPGAITSGSAPTTVTRTVERDSFNEEVRDDIFSRFDEIGSRFDERFQGIDDRIRSITTRERIGINPPKDTERERVRREYIEFFGTKPREFESTAKWQARIRQAKANAATSGSTPSKPATKTAPSTGTKYTVRRGDTLWKIAGKFGLPHWRPIYDANVSTIGPNPDAISPGQVLVIPK